MLFNSYELIFFFLPLTLGLFWVFQWRNRPALALAWLVAASFFFYSWGSTASLGLFGISILVNYVVGTVLAENMDLPLNRRWVLIGGIIFNLALLGYFKYASFAIASVNSLFQTQWSVPPILLPLGISFFTFGQISYLVDTYRGKAQEENFLNYCLYVSFFPKLIAGPIVYYRDLMPQFASPVEQTERDRLNSLTLPEKWPENLAVGLAIFSIGLFKKVIIADHLVTYSEPVFTMASQGQPLSIAASWIGAIAFALQLYFDFSGYTDMAIGSARLFGIQLPLNFNSPYKASKISQLWNAWHMTLTRFFRDYVYFPLARVLRRYAFFRSDLGQQLATYGNTFTIMLLIGLWHGASWNYVLWGCLNGVFLIVYQMWRELRRRLGQDLTKQSLRGRIGGWFLTFTAWTIAIVLARATSLPEALTIWRGMIGLPAWSLSSATAIIPGGNPFANSVSLDVLAASLWIITALGIVLFTPNTQQWLDRYRPALDYVSLKVSQTGYERFWERWQWQPTQGWAVVTAILTLVGVIFVTREKAFIYFQF